MYEASMEHFPSCDIAILCAAVADFTVAEVAENKVKRGKEEWLLQLTPTKDIAASLGQIKTPNQQLIGFALETQNEETNAQAKLQKKNLDYIVLNSLRTPGAGFGTDTNEVTIFSQDGSAHHIALQSKKAIAKAIVDSIENK